MFNSIWLGPMTKEPRRSFNYDDRFVSERNYLYLPGLYIPAHFRVINRLEFLKTHYRDQELVQVDVHLHLVKHHAANLRWCGL